MIVYILIIGGVLILIFTGVLIARTAAQYLVVIKKGTNNHETAVNRLIGLVRDTKREMLIHDDGDLNSTLYQDDRVLEAIKERLQSSRIKIRCLFNNDETLGITVLAADHNNLEVRCCPGSDWKSDLHFKLVDGGRIAYITEHRGEEIAYRIVDCKKAPRTGRRMQKHRVRSFNKGFRSAAMPTASSTLTETGPHC